MKLCGWGKRAGDGNWTHENWILLSSCWASNLWWCILTEEFLRSFFPLFSFFHFVIRSWKGSLLLKSEGQVLSCLGCGSKRLIIASNKAGVGAWLVECPLCENQGDEFLKYEKSDWEGRAGRIASFVDWEFQRGRVRWLRKGRSQCDTSFHKAA